MRSEDCVSVASEGGKRASWVVILEEEGPGQAKSNLPGPLGGSLLV